MMQDNWLSSSQQRRDELAERDHQSHKFRRGAFWCQLHFQGALPWKTTQQMHNHLSSMAHDRISPSVFPFASSPHAPKYENDICECWIPSRYTATYWRYSVEGLGYYSRSYTEDCVRRLVPGTTLDPKLPLRDAYDVVRHAQALLIDGRCVVSVGWKGLRGRTAYNFDMAMCRNEFTNDEVSGNITLKATDSYNPILCALKITQGFYRACGLNVTEKDAVNWLEIGRQ